MGIAARRREVALGLVAAGGLSTPAEMRQAGVDARVIRTLVAAGEITAVNTDTFDGERTLLGYTLPGVEVPQSSDKLADVVARHPRAVLCLHSALRIHDMTDVPDDWITAAVPSGVNRTTSLSRLRLVHWTLPEMMTLGVMEITVGGRKCRVTDPARTVADIFRPLHARFVQEDIRRAALSALAAREGVHGLDAAGDYAFRLGWPQAISEHIAYTRLGMGNGTGPR